MNNLGQEKQIDQNIGIKTGQQPLSFKSKQQIACTRATKYVADWLFKKELTCNELVFDKKIVSKEKDIFRYAIRAIDRFNTKVYLFELSYTKQNLEVSFVHVSQNPVHFVPGDICIPLSGVTGY